MQNRPFTRNLGKILFSAVLTAGLTLPCLAADAPADGKNTREAGRDAPREGSREGARDGNAPREGSRDGARDNNTRRGDQGNARPENRNNTQTRRGYDVLKMGPNGVPMPADKTRTTEAKRELDDAKAELSKALGTSTGPSTAALENELWRNDEYKTAVLEMRRAHADYDAVRKPIFDALRTDQYYRDLENKQRESQRVISSMVLTGRGSFDYLFPHAMAALEVRKRMTREEIIALAQAPEVEDARQRLLIAAAKVRAIKINYTQQASNPEALKTAKASLDHARDRVRTAQDEYDAAVSEAYEYERIRADYIAEVRRTGRTPVAGGR